MKRWFVMRSRKGAVRELSHNIGHVTGFQRAAQLKHFSELEMEIQYIIIRISSFANLGGCIIGTLRSRGDDILVTVWDYPVKHSLRYSCS